MGPAAATAAPFALAAARDAPDVDVRETDERKGGDGIQVTEGGGGGGRGGGQKVSSVFKERQRRCSRHTCENKRK